MLGDVFTTVSDGLLGFSTNKGTGIFTAIGASPVKADQPVTITGNMGVTCSESRELLGRSLWLIPSWTAWKTGQTGSIVSRWLHPQPERSDRSRIPKRARAA